jgi:hypothetical protein
MKFRIKVEELNNGEKEYTPQVRLNICDWWWENIFTDNATSLTMRHIYKTKEEALEQIERYKTYLGIEESKKVKKTTYVQY